MHKIFKRISSLRILPLCLAGFSTLTSCGGPSHEAAVANFVQTLMAGFVEGNLQNLQSSTGNAPVSCQGGSGTFTVGSTSYGTIDPLNPGATVVNVGITFSNCLIKVCGKEVTVNGTGATLSMSAASIAGSTEEGSISVGMSATDLAISGFISGSFTFGYNLTANATRSSFDSLAITEASPAAPFSEGGKTYNASDIPDLADGC